ncbi:hypothetical protein DVH05_006050 [Phytophthora capsici]|nr:hypothetical protein DVH05_006050 [Phytophthora capsici]
MAELERNALKYPDGCYIEFPVMIFDDYNESADLPCTLEPVCKLDCLKRAYTVYRIAAEVPKKSKMSNVSKKQRSRKKLMLCRD